MTSFNDNFPPHLNRGKQAMALFTKRAVTPGGAADYEMEKKEEEEEGDRAPCGCCGGRRKKETVFDYADVSAFPKKTIRKNGQIVFFLEKRSSLEGNCSLSLLLHVHLLYLTKAIKIP